MTNHRDTGAHSRIPAGPPGASVERISGVVGGLGLLLCVAGFFANRAQFFQSYLFAFIYWTGFTLGGLCVLLMAHMVGGTSGVTPRRFFGALMRTLPLVMFLFRSVLGDERHLSLDAPQRCRTMTLSCKSSLISNVPFFLVRIVIYFAIWLFWGLRVNKMADEQDRTGDPTLGERMRAFSAPGLLIFSMTASFA